VYFVLEIRVFELHLIRRNYWRHNRRTVDPDQHDQGFVNNTASTLARLTKPVSSIPPLLEVGILRACQQTYKEGSHILYTQNNFAAILRQGYYWKATIPYSLKHSCIRKFRIEVVQIYDDIIWVPRVGKKELVYHVADLSRELKKREGLGDCTLR